MLIDTHCHLEMMVKKQADALLQKQDYQEIGAIVDQAFNAGVQLLVNVGTSIVRSQQAVELARTFAPVYATVGIHPCDAGTGDATDLKSSMQSLQKLLDHKEENKIVAIGEIGLDFYHKPYDQRVQTDFFKAQIELALENDVPIVIHVRDAADELLKIIEPYVANKLRGVFHCFLQQQDFAQTILDWGFYVGLDAPITYPKNEALRSLFKDIPLERIVLETDAPFLPPQQFRGQQNTPVYIPLIAAALAQLRGVDCDKIEHITTANAYALFAFKPVE
jgi:TatD DNase family protein